ncbi:DUF2163 domain-containing protein [Kaistia terrae]|uniref:DUF2163 domain-containing protein n=1 Tax=Kaistia terrae TaxID=537017 RepID=A0ABW0PUU9_9HYPH|nr:DUF2163 domain-containing protein [Kaistia terrae]MCX5576874.1 DUF2163 domain-containing protein [Kaistia terrae]
MRSIPEGLAAHIAGDASTLCHGWRLTRKDGVVLGFTDHDRDLVFDGVIFEAATGLLASEASAETGMVTGGMEVAGALISDRLSETELAAGAFDHAKIETFLVNWQSPDERLLLRVGHIGEVLREDGAFRVEIRGLAAGLDEPQGRVFRAACDADLGDQRCKVDLDDPVFRGSGTAVAAFDGRRFTVSGLDAFASGWFERGTLVWTSGANEGRRAVIKMQRLAAGALTIELWNAMTEAILPGDGFTITAGCDKRFETCREKFANALNFRGFPHMPGNDFALGYARNGGRNTG